MSQQDEENSASIISVPITREQMMALCNRMLLEDAYPSNVPMKRQPKMRMYVAVKYGE